MDSEIRPGHGHVTITPSILYFGTPVALLSTENADGSANLAPMSSVWALGHTLVLGVVAAQLHGGQPHTLPGGGRQRGGT